MPCSSFSDTGDHENTSNTAEFLLGKVQFCPPNIPAKVQFCTKTAKTALKTLNLTPPRDPSGTPPKNTQNAHFFGVTLGLFLNVARSTLFTLWTGCPKFDRLASQPPESKLSRKPAAQARLGSICPEGRAQIEVFIKAIAL